MPYVPVQHAAASLNVSDRTVRRRIAADELKVIRQGGRVMVWVDTPTTADTLSKSVEQVAKIGTAGAVQRVADRQVMADTLAAYRESVRCSREDLRAARWTALGTTLLTLGAIGIIAWGGLAFHRGELRHLEVIHELKTTHAVAVDRLKSENRRLSDSVDSQAVEVRRSQQTAILAVSEAVMERNQAIMEAERLACQLERCEVAAELSPQVASAD
jgi:hypothetical protein